MVAQRNELYYQSGDRIMAVSYRVDGDNFIAGLRVGRTGRRDVLGHGTGRPRGDYCFSKDVRYTAGSEPERHVVFLQNFFDELRRRVPVSGK